VALPIHYSRNILVLDASLQILEEGKNAMGARYSWLFEPLPLSILVIMVVFGYITFILKSEGLQLALDGGSFVAKILTDLFGSVDKSYFAVMCSWYLAVFLHVLEAIYVAYEMKTKFKVTGAAAFKWFVLVSGVGYPVTRKALEFIKIDDEQYSKKDG
jgi:hypothetical protein